MILKHLLVAPKPLTYEPRALMEGVKLLKDWDPDAFEDDSDDEDSCSCFWCYGYILAEDEKEEDATSGRRYKLPKTLQAGQSRICRWLATDTEICREHGNNARCFPAILATCRQIYDEGQHFIYQNTITVTYFAQDIYLSDYRAYVLGHRSSIAAIFEEYPLSKQVKRWNFNVWCDSQETVPTDEPDLEDWSSAVLDDVVALQAIGKLDCLAIDIKLLKPSQFINGPNGETIDYSQVYTTPIRMLCSKECMVSCDRHGPMIQEVYDNWERHTREEIMSDWRPRHPRKLFDAVLRLSNKILGFTADLSWQPDLGLYDTTDFKRPAPILLVFDNIGTLIDDLGNLLDAVVLVEFTSCLQTARKIVNQATNYVKNACRHLDEQATIDFTSKTQASLEQRNRRIIHGKVLLKEIQGEVDLIIQQYRLDAVEATEEQQN